MNATHSHFKSILLMTATAAVTALSSPDALAAPANDNFANSIAISGSEGTTNGDNIDATDETNEPPHDGGIGSSSVWWSWTAPSTGTTQFDTFGSDFDTVLAVYSGSTLLSLSEVASNDDSTGSQSRVEFSALAGQVYHIAVCSFIDPNTQGSIVLNWSGAPPAPVGTILVYKRITAFNSYFQTAEDTTPSAPSSGTFRGTDTAYTIYDVTNRRTATVYTWTEKVGKVTTKYYSVSGVDDYFPYTIIPLRGTNTFQWADIFTVSNENQDTAFNSASTTGYSQKDTGKALPVVLTPTLTVNAPRSIASEYLYNTHDLTGWDYDLDEALPNTIREFYRYSENATQTLDTTLTKAANLEDIVADAVPYAKKTAEAGVQHVIKLLVRLGYKEDSGYGSAY